jgi:hypothetical protein
MCCAAISCMPSSMATGLSFSMSYLVTFVYS